MESNKPEAELTVAEAGRRGGTTTRDRKGIDFYSQIGKKGGLTVAKRGPAYFAQIGALGGATVRDKYGSEKYRELGRIGGAIVAQRGSAYYREIGALGAAAKKRKRGNRDKEKEELDRRRD